MASRSFVARITISEHSGPKLFTGERRFSYVTNALGVPPRAPEKPEYVRSMLVMELAKLFADSCITIVTDERIE